MTIDGRSVKCPVCAAEIGAACVWAVTRSSDVSHEMRLELAYMQAETDEPIPADVMERAIGDLV